MGNLGKAVRYAKKNGFSEMIYTAIDRKGQIKEKYRYLPPEEAALEAQQKEASDSKWKISILVPAYETKPEYLRALVESVLAQTYGNWELLLIDAGSTDGVKKTAEEFEDKRIRYEKLSDNLGISGNSNAGLKLATGDYVALLDHDDLLTPDALYEMAKEVTRQESGDGTRPFLVYSDEDKCDAAGKVFHTPHYKKDFNLDLFLTNNYICHFSMVRRDVIAELGFRKAYDGAQDYDLFLRVVLVLLRLNSKSGSPEPGISNALEAGIRHVPKVLYHWRCHESSTADNPESKFYAYEAGRRAVEDWYRRAGIRAVVEHDNHLGFYRTEYGKNLFRNRPDIGVIGGKLTRKNRVTGGAMEADGTVIYDGLHRKFSGYMNRGQLTQDVTALDIRCVKVRPELRELYLEYIARLSQEDPVELSLEFSGQVAKKGYFLVYMPTLEEKI